MKHRNLVFTLATILLQAAVSAQTKSSSDWVGVWHAELDGQPGTTLTLADDTGELGGTLVMNMVSREGGQPHVIAADAHVLVDPRVNGNTLTFRVKRFHGTDQTAQFSVVLTGDGKAKTRCLTCGADAPVVELVKGP